MTTRALLSVSGADLDDPPRRTVGQRPGLAETALNLVRLARRLAEPSWHGDHADHAFTVVVPALPGFPFSQHRPRHDEQTRELGHSLMTDEPGFHRYAAHGGDRGGGITSAVDPSAATGSAAPALAGHPAVLHRGDAPRLERWRRCAVDPVQRLLPADDGLPLLVQEVDLDALRPYYEYAEGLTTPVKRVTVPTAVAALPHDLTKPPRSWAARTYDVARYSVMPRGGHFAPHEAPELPADDMTEFLRPLRQRAP